MKLLRKMVYCCHPHPILELESRLVRKRGQPLLSRIDRVEKKGTVSFLLTLTLIVTLEKVSCSLWS